MKKGGITRSTGFQVLLYFLLTVGTLCCCFCMIVTVWLWDWGASRQGFADFEKALMASEAYDHLDPICGIDTEFPTMEEMKEAFYSESANYNVKFSIFYEGSNIELWTNAEKENLENYHAYEKWFHREKGVEPHEYVQEYRAVLYVDRQFEKEDAFRQIHEKACFWYYKQNIVYTGAVAGCLLAVICFIWILCNAGHRWNREGIIPGVLSNIYLDVLTAFFGLGAIGILIVESEIGNVYGDIILSAAFISVIVTSMVVWCTLYMRELALRFKLGKWWRHTLVYRLFGLACKVVRFLWKCLVKLIVCLPEIHLVVVGLFFCSVCEAAVILNWAELEVFVCWFLEKIVMIPLTLYCAMAFWKLRRGSRALAQGDLSCKLDTRYLLFHFKEHGENLNQIGTGISKAVEERLRSERLKTELITNVSHDLKTPLTSVINYADLLAMAAAGDAEDKDAQINEYSEVLLRQANRLKKLLEDLVEASKAATGNVEIQSVPCELGVMLTQAAGEYEERFAAKQLRLVMRKQEEEIWILADGRQLWRVFENLLSNICKYAQEDSRVYLNMEKKERNVEIIFRNISKYELDVPTEELTERFVRGDASRHMEGSGLGLSIAKSLVDLQNGTMQIITDGDLFKVILSFPVYEG